MTVGPRGLAAGGSGVLVALVGRVRATDGPTDRPRSGGRARSVDAVLARAGRWCGLGRCAGERHRVSRSRSCSCGRRSRTVRRSTQAFAGGGSAAAGTGPRAPSGSRSRVRAGAPLQDALDQWVAEDPDPAVALVADALAIASVVGRVARPRHRRRRSTPCATRRALQREVRALASQAQASAAGARGHAAGLRRRRWPCSTRASAASTSRSAAGPLCLVGGGRPRRARPLVDAAPRPAGRMTLAATPVRGPPR